MPCWTTKVEVLTVEGSRASENNTLTLWFVGTPVAPVAGFVALTTGGVESGEAPVVKPHEKGFESGFPDRSFTPVEAVIVNAALGARPPVGVNVAVFPV